MFWKCVTTRKAIYIGRRGSSFIKNIFNNNNVIKENEGFPEEKIYVKLPEQIRENKENKEIACIICLWAEWGCFQTGVWGRGRRISANLALQLHEWKVLYNAPWRLLKV